MRDVSLNRGAGGQPREISTDDPPRFLAGLLGRIAEYPTRYR